MTSPGILAYDLAHEFCKECGRHKTTRLMLPGIRTGCSECDKVTLRHRCPLPDAEDPDIPVGESWACPECGSAYQLSVAAQACPECCGDCGHTIERIRWALTAEGDPDSAPPYERPFGFWGQTIASAAAAAFPGRPKPAAPEVCHVTPNGIQIHVKPACRCRKGRPS